LETLNDPSATAVDAGVKPTSCCNGVTYNKTLLRSPIFMSPESTLTMEGLDGQSQFDPAGKEQQACPKCGQ
jgi:hypothetical protein